MNGVRRDWMRVERRLREARRGPVRVAVATELDRWLRAAGFPPTEGTVEIVC